VRRLFALALIAVVAGCGGANEPSPVDRPELLAAFSGIGEPLTLRLDMRRADPGSPVDAIFVPAAADVRKPPFEVDLFDNEDGARKNSRSAESAAGGKAEVVLHKNVIMFLAPFTAKERRKRLISALMSL